MVEKNIKRRKIFCYKCKLHEIQISVSTNEAFLEPAMPTIYIYYLWLLLHSVAELSSCPQNFKSLLHGLLQKKFDNPYPMLKKLEIWRQIHLRPHPDSTSTWMCHPDMLLNFYEP